MVEKPENEQTFDNFKQFFTAADDDRRKNSATTGNSGYSANTIEQLVQHQMNNILHQWMQPDENPTSPPPPPSTNEAANSTITIEQIRDEIVKISDKILTEVNNQKRPKPPPFQGKVNGENATYCWSHGITKILGTTAKPASAKKEVALNNRMGGSNERCKAYNNNSS